MATVKYPEKNASIFNNRTRIFLNNKLQFKWMIIKSICRSKSNWIYCTISSGWVKEKHTFSLNWWRQTRRSHKAYNRNRKSMSYLLQIGYPFLYHQPSKYTETLAVCYRKHNTHRRIWISPFKFYQKKKERNRRGVEFLEFRPETVRLTNFMTRWWIAWSLRPLFLLHLPPFFNSVARNCSKTVFIRSNR